MFGKITFLLPIRTFIADAGFRNVSKYPKIKRTIKGTWTQNPMFR